MKKEEMVKFITETAGTDPEDYEGMNIAEVSKHYRAAKQAVEQHEKSAPIIQRPDMGKRDNLEEEFEVGKVTVGERTVPVSWIVGYKGPEVHPVTGAHQLLVKNPATGTNTIVTFEVRDEVIHGVPIAVIEDWRVRAQVLYYPHNIVVNPTLGQQVTRVHARKHYYCPLDVNPDKRVVERMANYIRGTLAPTDETDQLQKAIAAHLIPESGGL